MIQLLFSLAFEKVVIWGRNLHTHTHSYIHQGFYTAFKKLGYKIRTNDPWSKPIDNKTYQKITKNAQLSPAIQGQWQAEIGYIPCRIFKNISYGCLGITNSKFVYDLFNQEIVFDEDESMLCKKAIQALKNFDFNKQKRLMKFVKEKHTYINRAQTILKAIDLLKNSTVE